MPLNLIIKLREKDLGEFSVRLLIPYAKQRMVGERNSWHEGQSEKIVYPHPISE